MKAIVVDKTLENYGISAKKWSGPSILKVIKGIFDVNYRPSHSCKLIEKMGLDFIKGSEVTTKEEWGIYQYVITKDDEELNTRRM